MRAFLPAQGEFPDTYQFPFELPVLNQGGTGMCIDYALTAIKTLQEWKERGQRQDMGLGYLYGNRLDGHWRGEGLVMREALETLYKMGEPTADVYNVTGTYERCAAYYQDNRERADKAARPQRVKAYARCQTPFDVMGAMYHGGSPVLMGIVGTIKFMFSTPAATGIVPDEPAEAFDLSKPGTFGHGMYIDGWKTIGGRLYYRIVNSWGTGWGLQGRAWLPADYPGIKELWAITDAQPNGRSILLTIGSTEYQIDDGVTAVTRQMDAAAFIKDGRTQVPIRFVVNGLAELLGRPLPVQPITDERGNVLQVRITVPDPE